jgi:hypothetical protein
LDSKSSVLQAVHELMDVPAVAPFVEVIGTEVFTEGSALQHLIGGGEDRGGDGANGLFGAAAGAQAAELRLEVTGVLTRSGCSSLGKGGFEPGGAFAHPGGAPLAGTLVVARAQAGPGDRVPGGWKAAHIAADFGKDDALTQLVDAGNSAQQFDGRSCKRARPEWRPSDRCRQLRSRWRRSVADASATGNE